MSETIKTPDKLMVPRKVKLYFSWQAPNGEKQLEAYIGRNGRFYGICAIAKCKNPNFTAWWIKMLIPGGMDYLSLRNPVLTLAEAKQNARTICESVIADFQGITLT